MAVSKLYSKIGQLGSDLAQQHYALTTDIDGVLPWKPTDADMQELVKLLDGRGPTLEEIREFESGYRESMLRLDGNAHDVRIPAVARHELYAALAKYGVYFPPESTPERLQVELLVGELVQQIRIKASSYIPKPIPDEDEPESIKVA